MVVCLCVIPVVCLSFSPSLCVCGLLVAVFFFLGYACSWSLSSVCLSACAVCLLCVLVVCWLFVVACLSVWCCYSVCLGLLSLLAWLCWLFRVVGGLCVSYVCRLLFFLFSFFFWVVVCKPRVLCVVLGLWRFVFGGLLGGVGGWGCWFLGLGWGFCFVGWLLVVLFFGGGCWWCCFLGVVGVGVVLWAILLLLLLLLFFCLECGFGGCWAWCCCW